MYFVLPLVLVLLQVRRAGVHKKQKAMEVRRLKSIRYVFRLEYGTSPTCKDLFARKNVQQLSEEMTGARSVFKRRQQHELTTVYFCSTRRTCTNYYGSTRVDRYTSTYSTIRSYKVQVLPVQVVRRMPPHSASQETRPGFCHARYWYPSTCTTCSNKNT